MEYQQCKRCVMDNTSDISITFDKNGFCNYCSSALSYMPKAYFPNEEGDKKLLRMISDLKRRGKGKEYDCIMGLSGGLDSSYLAYLGATQWGLRILAVHVDDGFDTEVAKENNRRLAAACNIELINETPDSQQYFSLVRAFIKAGVPNIAIPQDNLIFGYMHKYAKEYNVKYFLSGANFALESILQRTNTHNAYDRHHILDINKKFGVTDLSNLHITSMFRRIVLDRLYGIKIVTPLDYLDYNRARAIEELQEFCGYNYYGGKHYESVFTKFMQTYYLTEKFSVDKRKSHLSSMIVSGQLSRAEALQELAKPLFNIHEMEQDIEYILDLIQLQRHEFNHIMSATPKPHSEYKTYPKSLMFILRAINKCFSIVGF